MWEIGIIQQVTGSIYAFFTGICIAILYDILKAVSVFKKWGIFAVFVKDIIFSFISAVTVFLLLMARTNGVVRGYILIFTAVGFLLFRAVASKFWLEFLRTVLKWFSAFSAALKRFTVKFCNAFDTFDMCILKIFKKSIKKVLKLRKNT